MQIRFFILMFGLNIFFSPGYMLVAQDSSFIQSPINAVSILPDAKLVKLEDEWAVVLSNKQFLFIVDAENKRFLEFLKDKKEASLTYVVRKTDFPPAPYEIIFKDPDQTFHLKQKNNSSWSIGFGSSRYFTIEQFSFPLIKLESLESDSSHLAEWKLEQSNPAYFSQWKLGYDVVIVQVWAFSKQWKLPLGYLIFYFDVSSEAFSWRLDDSRPKVTGFWISPN